MPTFKHGSKAVLKVADAAGVLTDISQYVTSTGLPRSADSHDVTTLGKTSKVYIPGLLDGTIPVEGKWDATADAFFAGILGVEDRQFEYYPAGVTAGLPKYSGTAQLTSYEISTEAESESTFSGEFQLDDDVTRGLAA